MAGRLAEALQRNACAARWRLGWQQHQLGRRARQAPPKPQIRCDPTWFESAATEGARTGQSAPRRTQAPLRQDRCVAKRAACALQQRRHAGRFRSSWLEEAQTEWFSEASGRPASSVSWITWRATQSHTLNTTVSTEKRKQTMSKSSKAFVGMDVYKNRSIGRLPRLMARGARSDVPVGS